MKIQHLPAFVVAAACVTLLGTTGTVRADQWFVLGEKSLNANESSVEFKTQGNRWQKDVKQVKLSIEGADVQITNLVLGWDNRPDAKLNQIGTVKAGAQTPATDAPGRKGRLKLVQMQYKILGKKPTATVKIWGFD